MSDPADRFEACRCCEGNERRTPVQHHNRPGLSAIAFRVGTHGRFKESMLSRISSLAELGRLGVRYERDFSIGLMDAWALVLDVLSFYQERIANENYLRTATQRRSLLELARLIGYELAPGVAVEVPLAFTIEAGEGIPAEVLIPAGTRAQSLPVEKDELPQSFETSEDLTARARWSELHPRRNLDQELKIDSRSFFFASLATGLRKGDPILLVTGSGEGQQELLRVQSVELQAERDRTLVICQENAKPTPILTDTMDVMDFVFEDFMFEWSGQAHSISGGTVVGVASETTPAPPKAMAPGAMSMAAPARASAADPSVGNATAELESIPVYIDQDQLLAHLEQEGVTANECGVYRENLRAEVPDPPASPDEPFVPGVYALRVTAAPFGHNAPAASSFSWYPYQNSWDKEAFPMTELGRLPVPAGGVGPPGPAQYRSAIHLERPFPEVVEGSLLVLENAKTDTVEYHRVASAAQTSLADYGISGKTTRIRLKDLEDYKALGDNFWLRTTTIHTASEKLELAKIPIEKIPEGTQDLLLEEIVTELHPGRRLIIEGERADLEGVISREELVLDRLEEYRSYTRIYFTPALQREYRRETVKIFANVVLATHGETRKEILGSGDAAKAFQKFTLREDPLTYTSTAVAGGAKSTLEVQVNKLRWHEAASFYPLTAHDRSYVLRRGDDGKTRVLFGDGLRGARLETGSENVEVRYRVGVGSDGLVNRRQITLLATKPLGVKEVTNPLPSSGAEDPESRDDARENAPLTVLTLDRAVSLQDFEDYARAFNGIGKARADWVWDGGGRVVHITVAGSDGEKASDRVVDKLLTTLNAVREPFVPVRVDGFTKLNLKISALVRIEKDREWEDLRPAIEEALRKAFSFEARRFGQRVNESEVLATIQSVTGVVAVDLELLGEVLDLADRDDMGLQAHPARFSKSDEKILPAQLMILGSSTVSKIELTEMP
jgi:predicted phage baseplate assembly protein